jgi:3-hydroxy-3-methylglutaryl CoA synthase
VGDFGILSAGAYVPRLRIDRAIIAAAHRWMAPALMGAAKGSRAFHSWDEDAITMAVEAARDCLRGADRDTLAALHLASTHFPYADLQNGAIVADALRLPRSIRSTDLAGSQRCGTSALVEAFRAGEPSLVIASDAPVGKPGSARELSYGAGAAAFAFGEGASVARLLGSASCTTGFVDHFRASGERHDYFWEDRWIRDEGYLKIVPETIAAALADAGLKAADITLFAMPSLLKGAAAAVARKAGLSAILAPDLDDGCGYAGAAHAPLMLAHALEQARPGDRLLLVGFGQGVDALIIEAGEMVRPAGQRGVSGALANGLATDSYLRMLSFYDGIDLEWGMRSERSSKTALTEQHRSAGQNAGFVAGGCPACATVQFPRLEYCVNPECGAPAAAFDDVPLADAPARLLTHTSDWLSYHPAPPLHVGFVQFDNGARLIMEVVDVGPEGIEPGASLSMVLRIKERDRPRGYNRYFWKSTPAAA